MKNILIFLSILLLWALPLPAGAQQQDSLVYTVVDRPPEFPGGNGVLLDYFYRRLRISKEDIDGTDAGRMVATFTITNKGKVKNVKLVRDPGTGTEKDFIRLIKAMPDWKPAMRKDRPVAYKYTLPLIVHFQE